MKYKLSIKRTPPSEPIAAPLRPDRFEWDEHESARLLDGEVAEKRYNPNQPRYPKGHPMGGQWAGVGAGGGGPAISFTDSRGKEIVVDSEASLYAHLVKQADGSYKLTPERQALHDRIVADALKGTTAVANPAMYMTGGGPASGKSTMLESDLVKDFPSNAVMVNADHIKEQLPEYHATLKSKARKAAAYVHQESSMIGDRMRDAVRANQRNIVYDTTGNSSYEKLSAKIERFRKDGYQIHAYYASLDTELAVKIANIRGDKTGRYVPETIVRETHENVTRAFDRALKSNLFDTVSLYDTNVQGKPRLVATGDRSKYDVHNTTLYNDFLRKAEKAKKASDDKRLTTHDIENILTEVLLGVTDSQYKGAEAERLREAIMADLAKLPADAEIIIGKEYPDPDADYSSLYSGPYAEQSTKIAMRTAEVDLVENHQYVAIKKQDDEKQIVYGEVYAPGVLDTYGEFMTAEDIEVMAHRFMQIDLRTAIDTNHDNIPNGAYPVESFVAREGDPEYTPGAWVLGVKIPDDGLWRKVKTGELNGFSFQSLVKPTSVEVEYDVIRDHVGKTESQHDHDHVYLVELDEIGNVVRGITSKAADGHFHEITRASHTEKSGGHNHRFFL